MVKPEKLETVKRLKEKLTAAKGAYFADFQGLDVAAATALRNKCREEGVEFEVVKNTLMRRAVDTSVQEALAETFTGPTAVATSAVDEVTPAKVIAEFCKEYERPVLKAGLVDGSFVGRDQVNVLAMLPGRGVLLSRFAGGLRSPVQRLHAALSSPLSKLAVVLKQVAEKQAS